MTDLCSHCGHALPNAVGPGVYCTQCGEPVTPNRQQKFVDGIRESSDRPQVTTSEFSGGQKGFFKTTYGRVEVALHEMQDEDTGIFVAEAIFYGTAGHAGTVFFASRDVVSVIGNAVAFSLGLLTNMSNQCYSRNSMVDAIEQFKATEHASQVGQFMAKGRRHDQ